MNSIKKALLKLILKKATKKNILSQPKVVELGEKKCIGYTITTSFRKNQKKTDIPPFYHYIYDNDKLDVFKRNDEQAMYCIFDFHENKQDFDYYIAVENDGSKTEENLVEVTLAKGKYIQVECYKRSQKAISMVAAYTNLCWIPKNGFKARNAPSFIVYDKRFHQNYKKYGCSDGIYHGNPVATVHIPID